LPLTNGKCIVDREKVKDIIQDIRLNMPNEIRQAKMVVADRNEILLKAQREANDIIRNAEEKAKKIASQEEIVKIANHKANEIMSAAQTRTSEIRQATLEYTANMLEGMEEMLAKTLLEVKQNRQQIKQTLR
jgi:F0F1-type ATP synthase membrane subunit b/b'